MAQTGRVGAGFVALMTNDEHAPAAVTDHDRHDHIAAIFADRRAAERSIQVLRSIGLGSEHLGVAVRGDDDVLFEHDDDVDTARAVGSGLGIGIPVGAIAGIALLGLAVPGIGIGGILAAGGASAIWGAVLGGYIAVAHVEEKWEEHQELLLRSLAVGEVMVVVCSHGRPEEVVGALTGAGGRLVTMAQ